MLSTTLMCGKSSKCWKTMPICARRRVRLVLESPTEMPLTTTSPCWNGSSPLTVLIKVLLPEPEGPHTTTTSPLLTAVVQLFSTCTGPYHLLTSFISIIAMTVPSRGSERSAARHRQHVAKRLRQDDLAHRLPVGEPQRVARPHLAARDGLDAGPHDLAVVGRLEHHERDQRGQERADLDRPRGPYQPAPDPGHQEVEPEDHEHERRRAHDVHVGAGRRRERAIARQAHHRQQGAEDDPAEHRQRRQREREGHALAEQVGRGAPDHVPVEAGQQGQWPACGIDWPPPISPGTASRFSSQRIPVTTIRFKTM